MRDDPKTKQNAPTIVLRINGKIHKYPLDNLRLPNGQTLEPRFVQWASRKIDLAEQDKGEPNLITLAQYRIPLDLTCFFFTIDGEGIDQPEYSFQFIGVAAPEQNQINAITAAPFILEMAGPAGKVVNILIGYKWQSLVMLKSPTLAKSFCMETHNGNILSLPPHPRQQIVNLQLRSHLDPRERIAEIKRLIKGYELMCKLWEGVGKREIKYTAQEAKERSEVLISDALPIIKNMSFGKSGLKIEPLAKKMKIGKQTIYDVDTSCRFHRQPGLIETLKEIYRQERARKSKPS
jgi:hypothetical protein